MSETINNSTVSWISRILGVSTQEVIFALNDIIDARDELLARMSGKNIDYQLVRDLDVSGVDVDYLASKLNISESEFSVWVEDNLIYVLLGSNLAKGCAGMGPTPKLAMIDFLRQFKEWFVDGRHCVLLTDGSYARFSEFS